MTGDNHVYLFEQEGTFQKGNLMDNKWCNAVCADYLFYFVVGLCMEVWFVHGLHHGLAFHFVSR